MPQKLKSKIKSTSVVNSTFDLPQNFSKTSKTSTVLDGLKQNKKKLLIVLAIIIGVLLLVFTVKFYMDLREAKNELKQIQNDPNAKAKEESQKVVDQVGQLVELPVGEEPTVATVTDPTKLADQEFFANSKAGDKVLIYQEAQRAILFRPDTNKVIEIAPLTLSQDDSLVPDSDSETGSSRSN